jgi:hypothetical protein
MEQSFADAANNHHFKRARWRRLWRQQIQDYLIAAIQNMRILLTHGKRPQHAAAKIVRVNFVKIEVCLRPTLFYRQSNSAPNSPGFIDSFFLSLLSTFARCHTRSDLTIRFEQHAL